MGKIGVFSLLHTNVCARVHELPRSSQLRNKTGRGSIYIIKQHTPVRARGVACSRSSRRTVLDQGGGTGHGRRKGPEVPPLLDPLHCRVLGGRKTEMGERQRPCCVPLFHCTWSHCCRD